MKTKLLLILVMASVLQVSCGDATTAEDSQGITGKFQKTTPKSDIKNGKITLYEIRKIDGDLYSLETSSKPSGENVDFKKKFYMELEYKPKKRLLRGNTGLGSVSFQFSKNFDTIRELGSSSKHPFTRVD